MGAHTRRSWAQCNWKLVHVGGVHLTQGLMGYKCSSFIELVWYDFNSKLLNLGHIDQTEGRHYLLPTSLAQNSSLEFTP